MRTLRLLQDDVTDEHADLLHEVFSRGVHNLLHEMPMDQLEEFIVYNADAKTILARLHRQLSDDDC